MKDFLEEYGMILLSILALIFVLFMLYIMIFKPYQGEGSINGILSHTVMTFMSKSV